MSFLILGQLSRISYGNSSEHYFREDMRSAYQTINLLTSGDDILFNFSLPFFRWSPNDRYLAAEFYLNPQFLQKLGDLNPTELLYKKMKLDYEPTFLFVIFERMWSEIALDLEAISVDQDFSIFRFHWVVLIEINNSKSDWKKKWFRFISLIEKVPEAEKSWVLDLLLLQKSLVLKDISLFKAKLLKLKSVALPYYIRQNISNLHLPDAEILFNQKFE